MANNLCDSKKIQIFHLLCEGNGIRSISRLTGASVNTISRLQTIWYERICVFNRHMVSSLFVSEIEADEIMTYVNSKHKTEGEFGVGICWVYVAIDRHSRMIIDFFIGRRTGAGAAEFLKKVSSRLSDECEISTDMLKSYVSAITRTGNGYEWEEKNKILLVRSRNMGVNALPRTITNRIESHNGVIRQHVSRLTRRTRCISKKRQKLVEHLTLFFFYYNFIKRQKTIKKTPAESYGIISKPMSIEQLISG